MSNDVSFKRADYIEALGRWATVRDVCAGQHRVVDRLPYINAHDKSPENQDRNRAYRERAVFKNATGHTRNGLLGLAFHKDPTLAVSKKLEYLQDNANGSGVSIYQHSQGTLEKVLEADRRSAAQVRAEEQRRQAVADEEGESARKKLELAKGRAASAESAAGGLRREIDRLRAGRAAACDTIAAQQRKAGTSAVVVLGGLLEESDRMAGSCAAALERSRIAGLTCEAVVDGMKGK